MKKSRKKKRSEFVARLAAKVYVEEDRDDVRFFRFSEYDEAKDLWRVVRVRLEPDAMADLAHLCRARLTAKRDAIANLLKIAGGPTS